MLAPINSIKHFIARTNTSLAAGAAVTLDIADAVAAPASATTVQVLEGAVIKAVWVEMWLLVNGTTGTASQMVQTLEKIPSNGINPTFTNMLNLQAYQNKKNILHTFQGVQGSFIDGNPAIAPLRAWMPIPKGKQRMGLGDRLVLTIATVGQAIQTCGMFIYKEYR